MKLCTIFPILNAHDLAHTAIDFANAYLTPKEQRAWDVDMMAIDNGSTLPFERESVHCVYLEKNIGVYPIFWEALKHTDADILAFFHSDLIIAETGWDKRVVEEFVKRPQLGLIGFVGSNEIDERGGRGKGTTSNFQGLTNVWHTQKMVDERGKMEWVDLKWTGSKAKEHGKQNEGFSDAAVVDGCAMIFRREVLEKIKQRVDFPIHHFYDRLLSCEVRELGYTVGVLGIGCDHVSGQTVGANPDYGREWCEVRGLEKIGTWDNTVYLEAERQWLKEYRDEKKLIPIKV